MMIILCLTSIPSTFHNDPMTTTQLFKERLQAYFKKKDLRQFPYDGQYLEADSIEFFVAGAQLLSKLLTLIEQAKSSIIIHIYSLKEDDVGNTVIHALARQAQNGVSVTLMTDAIGTNMLSPDRQALCAQSGIEWVQFNPPFDHSFVEAGRRAHHKLFLFDHTKIIIGGFNLGSHYLGSPNNVWHDYGIYLESDQLYEIETAIKELQHSNMITPFYKFAKPWLKPQMPFRILFQDGQRGLRDISKRITHALKNAKEEILIVSAYFFPDQYFLHLLSRACKRGVKVTLVVSEQSDVSWVRWASFHFLERILKNGSNVYTIHKNILHGKALMVDQKWLTLGSYNFHFTSQFFNVEANIETTDETVVENFRMNFFDTIINKSTPMDAVSFNQQGNYFSRIRNFLAYQFGLILYAFYTAHSKTRPLQ